MRVWHAEVATQRKRLELAENEDPWTSRFGASMQGLRKQANNRNFLHELINLRWAQSCSSRGLPAAVTADVPANLMVDASQAFHHQGNGPAGTPLSGSKLFWFWANRVLAPQEHMMLQGWPKDMIDLSGFKEVPPHFPIQLVSVEARKRANKSPDCLAWLNPEQPEQKVRKVRKPRMQDPKTQLIGLAGDAQCLPDCAAVIKAMFLCDDDPTVFDHPFDESILLELLQDTEGDATTEIHCFNPRADDI